MNEAPASSAVPSPTPDAAATGANSLPLVYLRAIRPKQWLKNLLLFSGLFLNVLFFDPVLWGVASAGFAIFCLLSGSVYLINDILDVEQDRHHPKKRNRPIAAGLIPIPVAWSYAIVLVALALAGAWFLGWSFFAISAGYWALVLSYSVKLKHVVLLDVMVLAAGFVVRALAGIFVLADFPHRTGGTLALTPWFFVCTLFLAMLIALCKRRSELAQLGHESRHTRAVLHEYPLLLIDQLICMSATICLVTYSLYCVTVPGKEPLIWTLPFVLFGIARYLLHVYRNDEGGAPEQLILSDPVLIVNVFLWLLSVAFLFTLGGAGM
jgi:4-hydroxybenzoate polyprenyltransferase